MNRTGILSIPEIRALDSRERFVRIPESIDVPLTNRVKQLIDTAAFRRLSRISQLGLVAEVYPAANHTRFEHSLGVYRTALLFLKHLAGVDRFVESVSTHQAEILICAALLHDIGHWPYCHPIEDIRLEGVPRHEQFASQYLHDDEISSILIKEWNVSPDEILEVLGKKKSNPSTRLIQSIMSGPIDVDKMDYLYRDSLHAGVPYGRQFDVQRLIASLTVNQEGDRIAISDKGRTAAEMMVFSRYVMFSEVYWHHAVRSATAMLQRLVFLLKDQVDFERLFLLDESAFQSEMLDMCIGTDFESLGAGLFGERRILYKRLAQFSKFENDVIYNRLARHPYSELKSASDRLAEKLSSAIGQRIPANHVLIDAPPVGLEVQFDIDVKMAHSDEFHLFGEISPVIRSLAKEQFDEYVKRVRVFVHSDWIDECRALSDFSQLIYEAAFQIA